LYIKRVLKLLQRKRKLKLKLSIHSMKEKKDGESFCFQEIKDEVDESIEAGESMHTKETAEWFTGRVQYMRDAGIYSLGELRAAPPFPG